MFAVLRLSQFVAKNSRDAQAIQNDVLLRMERDGVEAYFTDDDVEKLRSPFIGVRRKE